MKNVIIVHGKPSKESYYDQDGYTSSNFGWIPWLQNQLLTRDIMPNVPEMPHAYLPEYTSWKREFERFDVTPDTKIVAHSMGGGFIMRWLSENKDIKLARVILVAPSLDPLRTNETGFCEFEIDPTITDRTQLVVMTSDNDSDKAVMSRDMITTALPTTDVRMFSGHGHFIPEHTGKDTLEELVDIILE